MAAPSAASTHQNLLTIPIRKQLNELFTTVPRMFCALMFALVHGDPFISIDYPATVDDIYEEFSQELVVSLAAGPKELTEEQKGCLEYNSFCWAFAAKVDSRVLKTFYFYQIIQDINRIKEMFKEEISKRLHGNHSLKLLDDAQNCIIGQYIRSLVRLAELTQHPNADRVQFHFEVFFNGWSMFLKTGGFVRVLLVLLKDVLAPIRHDLRKFCTEYLADIQSNYARAVEFAKMSEVDLFELVKKNSGVLVEKIEELDDDIRREEDQIHHYKCQNCCSDGIGAHFSSNGLLETHKRLHEAKAKECENCFDYLTEAELVLHRINNHFSVKISE